MTTLTVANLGLILSTIAHRLLPLRRSRLVSTTINRRPILIALSTTLGMYRSQVSSSK